jgi:hypothetical protein
MNKAVLAVFAVKGFAPAAFADLAPATGVAVTPLGGAFTSIGVGTEVVDINDVFFDEALQAAGPAGSQRAYTATLAPPTGGEYALFLFLGAATTAVNLTDVRFHSGGYNPAANSGPNAQGPVFAPIALTPGKNWFQSPSFNPITLNNGYTGAQLMTFTHVTFFVQFTTPGTSRIQIDYIANPEPGTMALFGMGALALGGLALRRRNAKKLATVKA